MSLTVEWEPLSTMRDDGLDALIHAHWEEVGVHKEQMPLATDWAKYEQLEDLKILRMLAARRGEDLIGYSCFYFMPDPSYSTTKWAACRAIYVYRKSRSGGAGARMIAKAEHDFPAEAAPGYCRITYHDRAGIELLGPVLRKRGYVATDMTYSLMARA